MTNEELKQRFAKKIGADIPVRFRELENRMIAISTDLKEGRELAISFDGESLDTSVTAFRDAFLAGPQAA